MQPVARAPFESTDSVALSLPLRALLLSATLASATGASAQPASAAPTPSAREPREVTGYTLSPERRRQAVEYSRARYLLHFAGVAWEVVVLAALIALRLAPRFRDVVERVTRRRFLQALGFVALFLTCEQLLELPAGAWGHTLSVRYGLSIQGWGSWLWDWLKGHLITVAILVPVVWMLYGILRRSSRRWWLWFWLATLPIIVFVVFVAPVVIDPLFFEFTPLEGRAPRLVEKIEEVTERGGLAIPRDRMFLMDASRKLKALNAYVTGFGASKRVVVWDTTLERMTIPQTLVVFGHEMGHYVLAHIPKTIAFVAGLLFVALFAAQGVLRRLLPEGRERWGIRGLTDWASLPVLMLVFAFANELASPIAAGYSRANEHAADVYGLEVVHGVVPDSQKAAAEAFQILGEVNLADPDPSPFIEAWLYSHPPLAKRLVFARTYDPWSKGEPPRYVRDAGSK